MVKWLLRQIIICQTVMENETVSVQDRENAVIQERTLRRVLDYYRQTRKGKRQEDNDVSRNYALPI